MRMGIAETTRPIHGDEIQDRRGGTDLTAGACKLIQTSSSQERLTETHQRLRRSCCRPCGGATHPSQGPVVDESNPLVSSGLEALVLCVTAAGVRTARNRGVAMTPQVASNSIADDLDWGGIVVHVQVAADGVAGTNAQGISSERDGGCIVVEL